MGSEEITGGGDQLAGGGVNQILRVGATVRRPTGPWTPAVHGLLRQLETDGFDGAPRVHGITETGLEILDFIPGDVTNQALAESAQASSIAALTSAAALLRRYHDATVDYARAHKDDAWMLPVREPVEVVCHGDVAPYNMVLRNGRIVAMIDFDTAHPGPRVWDVAYAVYRWAPLLHPDNPECMGNSADQLARAAAFCGAYGLDREGRRALATVAMARLEALARFMQAESEAGNEAYQGHLDSGHHLLYLRDRSYIEEQAERITAALSKE
jgi:Ser/Thr protein kinase RdoA (MazF antagonist)